MKHIDELVRCEERPILNNEQDDAALVAGVLTTLDVDAAGIDPGANRKGVRRI